MPEPNNFGAAPPVTPVEWKWNRLDKDTYFYLSANRGRPLVLGFPAAPGEGSSGFDEYLDRFFVDEGYALGVLSWRGDFGRTALPSAIVAKATSDLGKIRGAAVGFDPNRMVFFGWGTGAFLALLLASDAERLSAAGIPPSTPCAVVIGHPMDLNPADAGDYIARRQFSKEPGAAKALSPLALASAAPPVMILSKLGDRDDAERSAFAANALRAAGRTVVQVTYPQHNDRNPRTYLGWHENEATQKLGQFLKTYCPAKKI